MSDKSLPLGNGQFPIPQTSELSPFPLEEAPSKSNVPQSGGVTISAEPSSSDYRVYACQYCSYKSKYRTDVCKHQSRKHKDQPPKIINTRTDSKLKIEPNSTISTTTILPHVQRLPRLPKMGRLECDVCNKFGTYSADKFYIHMAAHRNLKPFKCSFCGQRANYKSDVQKHIRNRKKYEQHDGIVIVLSEDDAKSTIDSYILERHRQSSQRRRKQHFVQPVVPSSAAAATQQPATMFADRFLPTQHAVPQGAEGGAAYAIAQLWCSTFIKSGETEKAPEIKDESLQKSLICLSEQKCSLGVFKRIKCTKCFLRANSRSTIVKHAIAEHGLETLANNQEQANDYFITLSNKSAAKTFFMYENTFGNLLSKPLISKFIDYNNESFSQVLTKLALKLTNTLGLNDQTLRARKSPYADECLREFLNVYAANDPFRIDWIAKAKDMLENGTDGDLFDNCVRPKTGKNTAYGCSSCPTLVSTNEHELMTHIFVHLTNGGIQCSQCNHVTRHYNLAVFHNIKTHGSRASMRFVRSEKNSRMLRKLIEEKPRGKRAYNQ